MQVTTFAVTQQEYETLQDYDELAEIPVVAGWFKCKTSEQNT